MTTYDNQSNATGVIYTPSSSDWSLEADGTYKVNISSLSLDPKVSTADQIVVVRQFDFGTIASTPSPLLTGAETWNAWTLPVANASGSVMYSVTGEGSVVSVSMSVTAADYLYQRTIGNTTTEIQLPTFSPTTDTVYIMRKTQDLMNYINWTAGSRITASQLNHGLLQLLNISQELSAMQDNKNTLDPFVGKPGGICPLEADGTISNSYIGSATLSNSVGNGIEGDGSSATPLKVDLAGVDGADSGLAFDGSGDLKVDSVDSLTESAETVKPLSAKQGYTLDQKIAALGSGFLYKGTIDIDDGATQAAPTDPSAGDTYDIIETSGTTTVTLTNFNNISATKGDIIRYSGTEWVEIDQAQMIRADGTVALAGTWDATGGTINADTQDASDSTTKVATTAFVQQEISGTKFEDLVDVGGSVDGGVGSIFFNGSAFSRLDFLVDPTGTSNKVVTTADTIHDLAGVSLSSPTTGQLLKHDGSNWVNATVSNDSYVVTVASDADSSGAADDSIKVWAAWNDANLGHSGGLPNSSTLSYLEFASAKHLMSATTHGAPAAVADGTADRLNFTAKQGITYRNGTLQFNELSVAGEMTTTLLDTPSSDITLNTTTLSNASDYDAEFGDYYITVPTGGIPYMFEGALIRIGTDDSLQSAIPLAGNADSTVKLRAGEMNVVKSVDRSTGRVCLKHPIKARISDAEQITIPTWSATAAYVDIVLEATMAESSDDDTIILERADGTKDTFTCVTSSPTSVQWLFNADCDVSGPLMAAAIDNHVSWVAAYTAGTNTIRITQAVAGVTGNTAVSGTLIAGDGVVSNPITPSLAGGTSPQVSDQVFDNMVFEDLNTGSWELSENMVAGTGSTTVTVTLPNDHGLAHGAQFYGTMDSCDITDSVSANPGFYTDINTRLVYTAVVNTDTGSRNTLTATLNNSKTMSAANDGGSTAQLSYGNNVGIQLTYGKNITFRNCTFRGFRKAVALKWCHNITFENCIFENGNNETFLQQVSGNNNCRLAIRSGCRNITVKGCTFLNDSTGIDMRGGNKANYGIRIENNIFEGMSYRGIGMAQDFTTGLIDSEIINNKITMKPWNSRRNMIGYTLEHTYNFPTGIELLGWNLKINNNFIGGRQAYVQTETPTVVANGYGLSSDGSTDYPTGGPTYRDDKYEKKKLPVPHIGMDVRVAGGGRRSFYTTTHGSSASCSPMGSAALGPAGENIQHGLGWTPLGSWDSPCSMEIDGNEIETSKTGISIRWWGGSPECQETIVNPRISHNKIYTLREGVREDVGYVGCAMIERAVSEGNNIISEHWSNIFVSVPTKLRPAGGHAYLAQGGGDTGWNLFHRNDGGVGGAMSHTGYNNKLFADNTIMMTSKVYKTYGMRIRGQGNDQSRYWANHWHFKGNMMYGSYQQFLWGDTYNHATHGNWNSRIDSGLYYNYNDTWISGAYHGSGTSWGWYVGYGNTQEQGGTANDSF